MKPIPSESLHHQLTGSSGPLVVLLHGLGSRGDDWIFQVEALRDGYRTLTIDLPGHGDSPMPSGWPTIGDMAEAAAQLISSLGGESAHLVGLSLGGAVALQIAVNRPRLARSLTVVNASATLGGGLRRVPHSIVRLGLLASGRMATLGSWVARGLFPGDDQTELRQVAQERIAQNTRRNYFKTVNAVLRFDLRSEVHKVQAPTLIVAADRDATIPMQAKRWLAEQIPNATLRVIEGSRHATPLDAYQHFNQLLLDFLREAG